MGTSGSKTNAIVRILDVKSHEVIEKKFDQNEVPSTTIAIRQGKSGKKFIVVKKEKNDCSWYVDYITIKERHGTEIFPVSRWINPGSTYRFGHNQYNACLPQMDRDTAERKKDLEEKRKLYEVDASQPKMPASVKTLPSEEEFSRSYQLDLGKHFADDLFAEVVGLVWEKLFGKGWTTLDDICKDIYDGKIFPEPMGKQHWKEDWFFGQQRLAGVCPTLITLCRDKLPPMLAGNLTPVNRTTLEEHLEMKPIAVTLHERRRFYCDLKIMGIIKDIVAQRKYTVCTPILLLYKNTQNVLLPVAIQLFQEPGPNNPVFFPSDRSNVWLFAKMWYNQTEAIYHESLAHLGFTHLIMESVSLNVHRQLSFHHPIFKLIAPHLLYIMDINKGAGELLLKKGGYFDEMMSCGKDGTKALIKNRMTDWRLDVDGTLPSDMERRGVLDPDVLPGYHYRDDALQLYNVIKIYVISYVEHYYDTDEKLLGDWEIQAFAK